MAYMYPDHDAVDDTWVGSPAYTYPDHDAVDDTWQESSAVVIAVNGGIAYTGSIDVEHVAVVVLAVAGEMPYSGDVGIAQSAVVEIAGAMAYSGAVILSHATAIAVAGAMPFLGDVGIEVPEPPSVTVDGVIVYSGSLALAQPVQAAVDGAIVYSGAVTLLHTAPPVIVIDEDVAPQYRHVARIRYTTDGVDERELLLTSGLGFTLRPTDTPAHEVVAPHLLDAGYLRREMSNRGHLFGKTSASFGKATISNIDGSYDFLDDCGLDGREYEHLVGAASDVFPSGYDLVFRCLIDSAVVGQKTVEVNLVGFEKLLDVPVCSSVFEGTGGLEGPESLAGKRKPRWYTRSDAGTTSGMHLGGYSLPPISLLPPPALPMILLDAQKLIYFVCENPTQPMPATKWNRVLDGGMPMEYGAPYASLEDLQDDGLAPEPGAARFFHGGPTYARLGSAPKYEPSAMPGSGMTMDGSTTYPTFTKVVEDELGLDAREDNGWCLLAGYYDGDTTYLQAFSDCAPPQRAYFGFDREGRFFVRRLSMDWQERAPAFEFTTNNVIRDSLLKMLPATGEHIIDAATGRAWRNPMHGQTLAPAVYEEQYPDYFDPGTIIVGPVDDVRVISVLHWLRKEYATDDLALAAYAPPPPPPPVPQVQVSGTHPYLGNVELAAAVGISIAGVMPYLGEVELTHGDPVEPEITIAGVMPYQGSIALQVADGLTTVFRDEFGGSAATLEVHTPDQTSYGLAWVDGFPPMSVAGGRAQVAPTYLSGRASLVTSSSPSGLPIGSLVITWSWRSPSSFEAIGATLFFMRLQGDDLSYYVQVSVAQAYDAETEAWSWSLIFPTGSDDTPVTITANTEYAGTLIVEPSGAVQLDFVGEALSDSVGSLSGIDLEAVELELRTDSTIAFMEIEVPDA
jgi:hypothetical protein